VAEVETSRRRPAYPFLTARPAARRGLFAAGWLLGRRCLPAQTPELLDIHSLLSHLDPLADDAMAPGSPTALEKTVIAQAVHQASSADLGAVARELNGHRLLEQRQGKPPVPWTERVRPPCPHDLLLRAWP
jgi:hypothetical protein